MSVLEMFMFLGAWTVGLIVGCFLSWGICSLIEKISSKHSSSKK